MPFTIKQVVARVDFTINFNGPSPEPRSNHGCIVSAESVDVENDRLVVEFYEKEEDSHYDFCFKIDPTAPDGEQLVVDDAHTYAEFAEQITPCLNIDLIDTDGNRIDRPRSAWRIFIAPDRFEEKPSWFISTLHGIELKYTPLEKCIEHDPEMTLGADPDLVQIIDVRSVTVAELSVTNPA